MVAIYCAIMYISNCYDNFNDFSIISDSKLSLAAIINLNNNNTFINNIRKLIINYNVKLYWIQAHVGGVGNEKVDAYDKEATEKSNIDLTFDYSKSLIKKILNDKYLISWKEYWNNSSNGRTT